MKSFEFQIGLVGPSGDREQWILRSGKLPKGTYGHVDWVRKVVTINKLLRSGKIIRYTICHELLHVTAGQNGSEEMIINMEENMQRVDNRFQLLEIHGVF